MSHAATIKHYKPTITSIENIQISPWLRLKDPVSSMTHLISCLCAVLFTPILLIHAYGNGAGIYDLLSLSVFMVSMIMLYGASASYHGFNVTGKKELWLKRLDHMMIFVLIAGSYTPICTIVMKANGGYMLLTLVWGIAFAGMIFKLLWVTCPKWISSVIYIAMGWVVIFAMPKLIPAIDQTPLTWLYAGGIIYTIGGVIYALKLISFNSRGSLWGSHEIFHLFVMGGSFCHFISMYNLF